MIAIEHHAHPVLRELADAAEQVHADVPRPDERVGSPAAYKLLA
jgi:hypothetical protein